MPSHGFPVYTVKSECQDCYKCIRHCPVKSIRFRDGQAVIMPERCIGCGRCVAVCPTHAKRVRRDLVRLRRLLTGRAPVYASLDSAYVTEFPEASGEQLVAALRRLGFAGVGETTLGAEAAVDAAVRRLDRAEAGVFVAAACPAVAGLFRQKLPELTPSIMPDSSPVRAHSRLLREAFGESIRVVAIGPCIARKGEADRHPEALDLALTFAELHELLDAAALDPAALTPTPEDRFVPAKATRNIRCSLAGGLTGAVRAAVRNPRVRCVSLNDISQIEHALAGLHPADLDFPVFVEAFACPGGCINGPTVTRNHPGLIARLRMLGEVRLPRPAAAGAAAVPPAEPDAALADALRRLGKFRPGDELNCGGCGYDSCRELAQALIDGVADASMCVSNMRRQAQRQANTLIHRLPAGVVLADGQLKIIECNRLFAEQLGDAARHEFERRPGLAGFDLMPIRKLAPLFAEVMYTGSELKRDYLRLGDRRLDITIFPVETGQVTGAVFFDVTDSERRRTEIAARARQVIEKNLATVQEIACSLGEHMADTELLLRSIADDYADSDDD